MSLNTNRTYEPSRALLYTARVLSALTVALGAVCFMPVKDGILPVTIL